MQPLNFQTEPSESKTVLLWVEDETLLELLSIFVVASGYLLLSARTEEEARKQWTYNSDRVDLIICDWSAPHVFSSTRFFLQCRPELPVICLVWQHSHLSNVPPSAVTLEKPFDQNQFLCLAEELLSATQPQAAVV